MSGVHRLSSVAELEARVRADRAGVPYVVFEDGDGRQQIVGLPSDGPEVPIGRCPDEGIALGWDPRVSRVHALLQCVGGVWTVVDDGFSRNGTFVGGKRVRRHRLRDGDVVTCGSVALRFRDPASRRVSETLKAPEAPPAYHVTRAQHRVLVALCRPMAVRPDALPATNKAIAAELTISVDAVKTHLRRLAEVFGVSGLPQNEQRVKLAWAARSTGAVTDGDLDA